MLKQDCETLQASLLSMFVALRTEITTEVSQFLCTLLRRLWDSPNRFLVRFDNYHREVGCVWIVFVLVLWCPALKSFRIK